MVFYRGIVLSIEEVIIMFVVVKFMLESSCLYCSRLALLNCFLGRNGICIGCAVIFAMMVTWSENVNSPGVRCML